MVAGYSSRNHATRARDLFSFSRGDVHEFRNFCLSIRLLVDSIFFFFFLLPRVGRSEILKVFDGFWEDFLGVEKKIWDGIIRLIWQ